MANCNLTLPCGQTGSDPGNLFAITNTNNSGGAAIVGNCPGGGGVVGQSETLSGTSIGTGVTGIAERGIGVLGISGGQEGQLSGSVGLSGDGRNVGVEGHSNSGVGVVGASTFGRAGVFTITVADVTVVSNPNPALSASTNSDGHAGHFHIDNPSNGLSAILGEHGGNGTGVQGDTHNGVGVTGVSLPGFLGFGVAGVSGNVAVYAHNSRIAPGHDVYLGTGLVAGDQTAYPLPVEQEKSADERGYYLAPELYGESDERDIRHVRYPEQIGSPRLPPQGGSR
jgi:hypothetical protein